MNHTSDCCEAPVTAEPDPDGIAVCSKCGEVCVVMDFEKPIIPEDGDVAGGIFSGFAILGLLICLCGFPWLSGPVLGGVFTATVICGIGAYRCRRTNPEF